MGCFLAEIEQMAPSYPIGRRVVKQHREDREALSTSFRSFPGRRSPISILKANVRMIRPQPFRLERYTG